MSRFPPPIPQDKLPAAGAEPSATEAGFMLLMVVVMCALVLIALAVAAPVVAKDLRRDKEVESEHRAQQYVRAIRLYYKKVGGYPASIDALKKTNNIRFLRQEYADPLTGKADWKLIHQGEQKTTVKGFFGQELAGLSSGGLGSAAGMNSGTGTAIGGSTVALSAGFSGIGSSGSSSTSNTAAGATGSIGSSGGFGSFGASGATGASGSSGALGGGGPIVGVGSARTGNSILTPNGQSTYETWEFWYDPRIEQLYQKGQQNAGVGSGGMGSQPASAFGATGATGGIGGGLGTGFGGSSSFGTFGSTGTTGTTGTGGLNGSTGSTTTPTSPQ